MNNKVLIAMSGGVDSSVAAKLLVDKGYECTGATMKLFANDDIGLDIESSCCSESDIADARNVAYNLGMPFYVLNFSDMFKEKVIENFVCSYENGCTPNPCIECNRHLKFNHLFKKMKELGLDYVATGHYARIDYDEEKQRYLLRKAADDNKDQSYVLYSMTQEQLSHTIFPLGELDKTTTRRIAYENGFINSQKPDSQDICFVKDGKYADFIEQYTKKEYPSGNFIDVDGNILGRHKGIIHYTIGQRKGLGLSFAQPMYVSHIDPDNNTVTLAKHEELFSTTLTAKNINLISVTRIEGKMRVKAKARYRHKEQWATVTQPDEDTIVVEFDEPQRAITKGQSVVLYDGDVVVGGGIIL